MRREAPQRASSLRPYSPLSSVIFRLPSFSYFFSFYFIHFRSHSLTLQDRIVRTPALLCGLEFRSFESSGSRQGTDSSPRFSPSPPSIPPLTTAPSPILAAPSSSSLADSSDSPSFSYSPSLSFSLCLSLSLSIPFSLRP